uniref:Methyltransferase domain-containing protein n=1 Tax=Eubacterium plexicaudatum ASF492 TaxID=1235802 RepID=N2ARV5_9FIRM
MSKYDVPLVLDENSSTGKILRQVEKNSIVLEFGCAHGKMTRYMKEQLNCKVYIVELDRQAFQDAVIYAKDGLCGDIEQLQWVEAFSGIRFDTILFADVLEHLSCPDVVLEKTHALLKDEGNILISVPNIGHGDILLNLYDNNFQYTELGLLDHTHIHFWGMKNLEKFCSQAGYEIVTEDAVTVEPFTSEQSRWLDMEKKEAYAGALFGKEYYDIYQFIYTLKKKEYFVKANLRKDSKLVKKTFGINASVIFDYGNGFEQETVQEICPVKVFGEKYYFQIDVPDGAKQLLFHPVQGKSCIVQDLYATSDHAGYVEPIMVKGKVYKNLFIFNHKDPCMVFACQGALWFKINLAIELLELDLQIYRWSVLEELIGKAQELDHQYQQNLQAVESKYAANRDALQFVYESMIGKLRQNIKRQEQAISGLTAENMRPDSQIYQKVRNEFVSVPDQIDSNCFPLDGRMSVFYQKKLQRFNEYLIIGNKTNHGAVEAYFQDIAGNQINLADVEQLSGFTGTIAVHVHLYYTDLLPEIFNYLNDIPFVYDLYISCQEGEDLEGIAVKFARLRYVNDVIVRAAKNRGRDLAPLYVLFGEEVMQHDYFLHIHSKKSLYTGNERKVWRKKSLDCLLGSECIVRKIFMILEGNRKIGLFFPETTELPLFAHSWLQSKALGTGLLAKMGFCFDEELFNYPAGSFFWAKTKAVKPLFDQAFSYEDFPEEQGQSDGTLAHALERAIAFTARGLGYEAAICDMQDGIIRFGKSYELYQSYFSQSVKTAVRYLCKFQIVTFDIFDTLITRKIYKPDDLFCIMEKIIAEKYGISCDFLSVRKKAEAEAWQVHQERTSIDHIYEKVKNILKLPEKVAAKLKQLETDLELEFVIPRRDVKDIFDTLIRRGVKVILLSDMYLTKNMIEKMLDKCGYQGYADLWVSCEKGCRKDNGSMWDEFFERYGAFKTVHVGDNLHADIQLVADRYKSFYYVMNPVTAFQLSKEYGKFKKYMDGRDVAASLVLGNLVNAGIYNSPFCMDREGEPVIENGENAGFSIAGPLFAKFMQWLAGSVDQDMMLLFLSREGYLLQELYELYCTKMGILPCKHIYFLTSRRAASMAAIQDKKDMDEVISQDYKGNLKNFFRQRFGIAAENAMEGLQITIPEDIEIVNAAAVLYTDEILQKSREEKRAYMTYIKNNLDTADPDQLCVVDLGYSGTIQYFLSKMLDRKVSGRYLCTGDQLKPLKIGCQVQAVYQYDHETGAQPKVRYESDFLEALLEAPFGQLEKFRCSKTGEAEPVYKDVNKLSTETEKIQDGIRRFVGEYAQIGRSINLELDIDAELAADILCIFRQSGVISQNVMDGLEVDDEYCRDAVISF